MALEIPGVDEAIFNDLMEGDVDLYKSILSSFLDKTPSVVKKLAGVTKLTLGDYATTVHGFKAACANICAEEARKMAYSLELKAKARDWDGVQEENAPFLKYIEELMIGLNDWYGKHK
jgi:HPt (histidine-containing phosphotransfer) domain-containing protein